MIVDVLLSANDFPLLQALDSGAKADQYHAVIIKVFKTGNTILSALNLGAEKVKIVHELDESPDPMKFVTIGGMPGGHKPNLPDSPAALNNANFRGREPVVSSFAVHRAVQAAWRAEDIFLVTFANVTPTVMYIRKNKEDFKLIKIVCCGADRTSYEDICAAGCFIDLLLRQFKRTEVCLTDTSNICLSTFHDCAKEGRLFSHLTTRSTRMCVARFSEFYAKFTGEDELSPNEKVESDDIHNCIQKDMYYFPCKIKRGADIENAEFERVAKVGEEFHRLKKIEDIQVHESAFWMGTLEKAEVGDVFTNIDRPSRREQMAVAEMGIRSSTISDFTHANTTRRNTMTNMLSANSYGSATSSDLSKKGSSSKKAHFSPTFSLSSNSYSREDEEMRKIEMEMIDEQSALAEGDEEESEYSDMDSSAELESDDSSGEQGGAHITDGGGERKSDGGDAKIIQNDDDVTENDFAGLEESSEQIEQLTN